MKDEHARWLAGAACFRFMRERQLERLRELARVERYDFGDVIVREGEAADAFFVLVSGRARVLKRSGAGADLPLNTLRPGAEFGESALDRSAVRTATVRCSGPVEVLRIDRADFLALTDECPEIRTALELTGRWRALHRFLYEFTNFGRLPASAMESLVSKLQPREFHPNEIIIREGDPPGPMFLVEEGRVRVFSDAGGPVRNRAFLRAGDFFGELSILTDSARAASAEAMSPVRLLALSRDSVRELTDEYPDFARLLNERRAQYRRHEEARLPLDFSTELPPADVRVHDKTALFPESGPESFDDSEPGTETGPGLPPPTAPEPGSSVDDVADTDQGAPKEKRAPDEKRFGNPFRRRRGRRGGRVGRMQFVPQIDEMDCGAACLAMVCRHYGRKVSLGWIRRLCHTSQDGTSLKAICHAANELGLVARGLKVSRRHLDEMPLPAIVHWEGNHWMVVRDVTERHVRVMDPAVGPRTLPRAEFDRGWSGYAALFEYAEAFASTPEGRPAWGWVLPFFRRYQWPLSQALLLAVVATCLQLLFPVFTQVVVDKVLVENDLGLLRVVVGAMLFAGGFILAASLLQQYLISFVAVRIDAGMLDYLTRQLLSLPMSYFSNRRTGDIQRRLEGARQVRQFLVQHGIAALLALVTLTGCIVLMAVYSLTLLLVFVVTLPLYGVLMYISVRFLRPIFTDLEECHARYGAHQIDAIKGIEAVKVASAEQAFRDTMLNEFLSVSRKVFRGNFIGMSYESVLQVIGLITTTLFLWVGATMVMGGQITVGAFVAFNALLAMAYSAVMRALGVWDELQMMVVLLNRLNDLFEQEPEQGPDRSKLRPVKSLEGHLELRQVHFHYGGPEAPAILSGIDLELVPGRTLAVVGRSGSGKTTLAKILAGLLEPVAGTLLYDHVDARTLNYRDLRRQIGMVLQDSHIFDDTILRNIAFGDSEPDFDRVLWAAQLANAHDLIMQLPMGYETPIGETGLGLSGGQRQRIAIARAIYKDPALLILDEATSALDAESERAIQDNLNRMLAGRTSVIVAHRLSTIRDADSIIVLEKGRIAEQGTHDDLMAARGLYFYLSSQQHSF